MKRLLAIVICVLMVGSVFAMAISAGAEEADGAAPVGAASDIVDEGAVAEPTDSTEEVIGTEGDDVNPTTDGTEAVETTAETTAETTGATIAPTTGATTAATTAATQAAATQDQKKPSPKTGENMWLWIGIGIFGVALVAIIITFVVKKKAK